MRKQEQLINQSVVMQKHVRGIATVLVNALTYVHWKMTAEEANIELQFYFVIIFS